MADESISELCVRPREEQQPCDVVDLLERRTFKVHPERGCSAQQAVEPALAQMKIGTPWVIVVTQDKRSGLLAFCYDPVKLKFQRSRAVQFGQRDCLLNSFATTQRTTRSARNALQDGVPAEQ